MGEHPKRLMTLPVPGFMWFVSMGPVRSGGGRKRGGDERRERASERGHEGGRDRAPFKGGWWVDGSRGLGGWVGGSRGGGVQPPPPVVLIALSTSIMANLLWNSMRFCKEIGVTGL